MCFRRIQVSNTTNLNIVKVNDEGSVIWEKKFQNSQKLSLFGCVLKINGDEFAIGSSTTSKPVITPLSQTKYTSKIFAIDSLGNVKWQWESQPSLEELGVGSLHKTTEGNWAYTSARAWYNATYNEISVQPKFIIRDEDFDIIREDTFGVADFPVNHFYSAIQLIDGGWLAVGVKPVNYPIPPVPMWYNSFSGWMVRLDSQGEQLWSRVDTAFWSYETGSVNYLYDAVELPSGSIIACGYSRTYEPFPKDWGWLINVSKDGCLDTLNCFPWSSSWTIATKGQKIKTFPNPTSDFVYLDLPDDSNYEFRIFALTGKMMLSGAISEAKIEVAALPPGGYLLQIWSNKRVLEQIVIKK